MPLPPWLKIAAILHTVLKLTAIIKGTLVFNDLSSKWPLVVIGTHKT